MECKDSVRKSNFKKHIDVFVEYILAVQEIRRTGHGVMDKQICSVHNSCHNKAHQFGINFIVTGKNREKLSNSNQ